MIVVTCTRYPKGYHEQAEHRKLGGHSGEEMVVVRKRISRQGIYSLGEMRCHLCVPNPALRPQQSRRRCWCLAITLRSSYHSEIDGPVAPHTLPPVIQALPFHGPICLEATLLP